MYHHEAFRKKLELSHQFDGLRITTKGVLIRQVISLDFQ
jgi:hypothetical protein